MVINMEEYYQPEALREALIIAGLKEIEVHGLTDFSLRRVASACGVSCAAPYRHFKGKSELILAIITYVNDQWALLQDQISEAFKDDSRRCLIEMCIASIRFWIANPHFRSIMLMDSHELDSDQLFEKSRINKTTERLIDDFCRENKLSAEETKRKNFSIRAIMYGSTQMLGCGELENSPESIALVKALLEKELE